MSGAPSAPDRERSAVRSADERRRQAVGVGVDPVFVLQAGAVEALAEVALSIEQADPDERKCIVGGLFEEVPGERSETSGVDRQRCVHGVLGTEERTHSLGRARVRRRWARAVGGERRFGLFDALHQLAVIGSPPQ